MVKSKESNKNDGFFKKYQKIIIPIIIVVSVVLLTIILLLVFGKSSKDVASGGNDTKAITENGVIKDEEYQGLKFTNTTLIKKDGIYTLSVDVQNTSKEVSKVMSVNIPIMDKNGNEIITLLGYIGKELKPNETTTIVASTSADLSGAYEKKIAEKK